MMKRSEDLLGRCPEPVARYLHKLTDTSLAVLDGDGVVVQCNEAFARLFGADPSTVVGDRAERYLSGADGIGLSDGRQAIRRRFNLQCGPARGTALDCHVFHWRDGCVLFGRSTFESDEEVFQQLTRLNNELSNQSRELAKKNAELLRANEQIEQLMRTDHLTGLANRRHFLEHLEKAVADAHRHGRSLSLAALDLDHFKEVNDEHGHAAGDDLLAALGEVLQEQTRKEDLPARIGGEEFMVLLVGADCNRAAVFADRLRREVASIELSCADICVTASLGVAELGCGESPEDLMLRADRALYRSKEAGRNRMTVAGT